MDTNHRFINALTTCRTTGKTPIIAEIKVSTPQYPDLLGQRSVSSIAQQYHKSGVACISVVTGKWFGGSSKLLEEVAAVTSLPLLRKDFIVSRSAIDRSQQLGASAVLLTKKLIDIKTLKLLTDYALSKGITPFIEVDSEQEMLDLKLDKKAILAICNRDIRTKETDDGDHTKSLSLFERSLQIGAGAIVSASAISSENEAKQLINTGFDGLLIGSAFLQAKDLERELSRYSDALKNKYKTDA